MNNYNIEKFRQDLIEVLNNSNILIGSAYYVLKDILNQLEKEYYQAIKTEQKEGTQPKQAVQEVLIPQDQNNVENQEQSQD